MHVCSAEEMEKIAADFARALVPNESGATVVALSGDLGAGKTTFVRGALRALGITEAVTSPTFVIAKTYAPPRGPFGRVVHIDAYRLSGAHELAPVGWNALLPNTHTLIFLEWPEQVPGALPQDTKTVQLTYIDDAARELRIA